LIYALLPVRGCSVSAFGGVAQLGERLLCKQEVIGSIPFTSTIPQGNGWWRAKPLPDPIRKLNFGRLKVLFSAAVMFFVIVNEKNV
jgi:hypothetical protein